MQRYLTLCFCWGLVINLLSQPLWAEKFSETTLEEVIVTAEKEKLKSLPPVQGAKIYRGKKTTVINLTEPPEIINNNYRQALQKTSSLLLSEETTPLVSIGYRGLDPHRAQFTQILMDGIPIHADIFGYPEAYYTPPLQVVEHIDFIHGGAALLYGPQPGGALNFVTQDPYIDTPFDLIEENSGGSHGNYSNYTGFTGTLNQLGYCGYFHHRQSQGFRAHNSQFKIFSGGAKLKLKQDPDRDWEVAFDTYHETHGEPGGLTRADLDTNSSKTNRLNDRFELNRQGGSLTYSQDISPETYWEWKTFGGSFERLSWRQRSSAASNFGTAPGGVNASTNDIEIQEFMTAGAETRLRHNYNALGFNDHTLTAGLFYYHSTSPRTDKRGTAADAEDGNIHKESDRTSNYVSFFLENLFQFEKLSIVPGIRLENIWQNIEEFTNLDKTTVPLSHFSDYDFIPLFGLGMNYALGEHTELYNNISQGYRPKIFTQAVPTGSGQTVNGDLEEGKSWQAELGLRTEPFAYLSAEASLFYMEFNDQIGTVGSTGAVIQNVGDARHQGLELSGEINLIQWYDTLQNTEIASRIGTLSMFSNIMLLDAKFTKGPSEGKNPQYAPDYLFKLGGEYRYQEQWKIRLAATFTDDHYANDSNTDNFIVPSYKVWDFTTEWNPHNDFISFIAGINNLFDEHYFARIRSDGIDPADGRNYYGGIKLIW